MGREKEHSPVPRPQPLPWYNKCPVEPQLSTHPRPLLRIDTITIAIGVVRSKDETIAAGTYRTHTVPLRRSYCTRPPRVTIPIGRFTVRVHCKLSTHALEAQSCPSNYKKTRPRSCTLCDNDTLHT